MDMTQLIRLPSIGLLLVCYYTTLCSAGGRHPQPVIFVVLQAGVQGQ
ncbi:hypothetical protein FOCG_18539 [Fusarium oxysporum f. sp. radicis-lycopersici 26381]|nr:hypothetical protein FOCG_18539 [Fusarium oxysporum f. sp. radicis-lycopersici 26381]